MRALIRVLSVCNPCNAWAGRHVDQPFLEDAFIRELRARHDVCDARHPDRRVLSPFAHGFTGDGVHVAADEDWAPWIVSGRTIDRGEGCVDIIAADDAEADRSPSAFAGEQRRRARPPRSVNGAWSKIGYRSRVGSR